MLEQKEVVYIEPTIEVHLLRRLVYIDIGIWTTIGRRVDSYDILRGSEKITLPVLWREIKQAKQFDKDSFGGSKSIVRF